MAGIKIVDLPALGRDLLSTDLLEMSIGGTASRKITGQEIMNASKLNVGSTPIVSGTVGRVLFQGTGNVLQQSANLFWDSTNNRLGIGTSTPARTLEVNGETMLRDAVTLSNAGDRGRVTWGGGYFSFQALGSEGLSFMLPSNARVISIPNATGNVLINTTTDAGFKLDVNGTGRFQNTLKFSNSITASTQNGYFEGNSAGNITNTTAVFNFQYPTISTSGTMFQFSDNLNTGFVSDLYGNKDIVRIFGGFKNPNGAYNYSDLKIDPTYQGNAASSIIRGIYYNPTNSLTGTYTHRAIDLTSGDFVWGTGYSQYYGNSTEGFIQFTTSGGTTQLWLRPPNNQNTWNASYWGRLEHTGSSGTKLLSASYRDVYVRNNSSAAVYTYLGGKEDNNSVSIAIPATTDNVLINTTTDAGFKLDVNGTARVSGNLTFGFNTTYITTSSTGGGINAGINTFFNNGAIWIDDTSVRALDITYNNGIKIANTTRYPLSLGTSSKAVASAQLEMVSTTQGFLPPRMTNAQRTAIVSPAVGLIVYCTDVTEGLWVYKSTGWTFIV